MEIRQPISCVDYHKIHSQWLFPKPLLALAQSVSTPLRMTWRVSPPSMASSSGLVRRKPPAMLSKRQWEAQVFRSGIWSMSTKQYGTPRSPASRCPLRMRPPGIYYQSRLAIWPRPGALPASAVDCALSRRFSSRLLPRGGRHCPGIWQPGRPWRHSRCWPSNFGPQA